MKERVLSGIFMGIPVLALVILGKWWTSVLVFVVGSIALIEYAKLMTRREQGPPGGLMILWMALFTAGQIWAEETAWFSAGVAVLLIATLVWALHRFSQGQENAITAFAAGIAGAFYIGWGTAHFIGLRNGEDGLFWSIVVVFAVWAADTGAYLIGSSFGKTKLIPSISPSKTWEGYIGGVFTALIVSALLPFAFPELKAGSNDIFIQSVALGVLIAILSPIGDLGISMLKRYTGAKDSSNLIPGHGGVLDRIDALLIAIYLGYYFLTLVINP